jgi:hypothetical protein
MEAGMDTRDTMERAPVQEAGTGWIVFSGIMLVIVGFLNIVDGLWAIDRADTRVDELLYADKLGGWGWFYLILGIILVLTGIGVFARAQLARWIGVVAAGIAIVANMLWVFVFPIASLVVMLLASLVLYGLVTYGEREPV